MELYSRSVEAGPSSHSSLASPKPRALKPTRTPNGDNKVSCTACRTVKCKCVESADPNSIICQRCTRLSIPCVYQAHQRGRRRKEGSIVQPLAPHPRDVSSAPSDSRIPVAPLRPPKRKRLSRPAEPGDRQVAFISPAGHDGGQSILGTPDRHHYVDDDGDERTRSSSLSLERSLEDDADRPEEGPVRRPHGPEIGKPANSVYHDVADRSIFSIAGVMERKGTGVDETDGGSGTAIAPREDPVGMGLLSTLECDSLFDHYFDQLQTCVCLLDPAIHTATYTRGASLELFTAVLAISCKFFRPEMYETLLAVANRLVNRAISDCVCAIELVQAICILHYWKKPTDGRGWLRLGHAIRLGYQLDLHLPRRKRLPSDEREARLAIDRERTWISLFCFDSTLTQLSDRPSMMHKAPEVDSWIRSIPYPLASDGQLDFAVKTSLLTSEVRQLQSCKGSYEVLRSGLRRVLEDHHRSNLALMADDSVVQLTSTSKSINKFATLALQLLVECTSLSLAPNKHRISLLHACVSASLDLLDVVVEGFARKGIMPMIEDAHSVAVASTAVRLIRFMSYLDSPAKASVMRKLTRVVIVCREAARGDQESHPAYLARFIHALLDKAHQSRQPSRESSPTRQTSRLGMTPMVKPDDGPRPSPLQQKTTPDQWWDEIGQFAYQEPIQPFKEHLDFWDGFPMLAGAMNTLSPLAQPGRVPAGDGNAGAPVDPVDSSAFAGLPWDAVWDVGFLGISQDPPMI